MHLFLKFLCVAAFGVALGGCAVATVAGAAAGAAISVTGAVVSTGVRLTGKVVEKTIDVVVPDSAPESQSAPPYAADLAPSPAASSVEPAIGEPALPAHRPSAE